MTFEDLASVSGKSGLYKILKPSRNGVILESLSGDKKKMVTGPNHRVSALKEISIYTLDEEGTVPLKDVFQKIYETKGTELSVSHKDSEQALRNFMKDIVKDYDAEKVYSSDIKKLVKWYSILAENHEDLLQNLGNEEEEEVSDSPTEDTSDETASSSKEDEPSTEESSSDSSEEEAKDQ